MKFKKSISFLLVFMLSIVSLTNICFAYNGNDAADYGYKYALNYNSKYKSNKLDCANFVSQCINAGGHSQTSSWYHKKVFMAMKISDNWGKASKLSNYLVNQRWAVKKKLGKAYNFRYDYSYSLMCNGDVIGYDWDNNGTIDHVSIVTNDYYPFKASGAPSNSPTYWGKAVSQHTTNRQNVVWHLYPYISPKYRNTCVIYLLDMR